MKVLTSAVHSLLMCKAHAAHFIWTRGRNYVPAASFIPVNVRAKMFWKPDSRRTMKMANQSIPGHVGQVQGLYRRQKILCWARFQQHSKSRRIATRHSLPISIGVFACPMVRRWSSSMNGSDGRPQSLEKTSAILSYGGGTTCQPINLLWWWTMLLCESQKSFGAKIYCFPHSDSC